MDVLVILEESQGSLHRLSREAIAGAQKLGASVAALAIGENADTLASELSSYDLEEVFTAKHELLSSYSADGYFETVIQLIRAESPALVVAGHTYQTRDFMPRVSAKLDIPFIPDIVSLSDEGFVKQVLNAKLNASLSSASDQIILSFQSATFSEEDLKTGSCGSEVFEADLNPSVVRAVSEDPFQEDQGDVDLESADVLVSVGRGIEKEENVPLAFELAKKRARSESRVTCVDKANVFKSMAFFRSIYDEVAADFPQVQTDYAYIDALSMYPVSYTHLTLPTNREV